MKGLVWIMNIDKNKIISILLVLFVICSFSLVVFAEDVNNAEEKEETSQNIQSNSEENNSSQEKKNTVEDLKNKKQEAESNLENTSTTLEIVKTEFSENLQKISELDEKISESRIAIESYEAEISELQEKIEIMEKALNKAEEYYYKQQAILEARIVATYEAGTTTYLDVLLSSSGISEFISNCFLISEITKYDEELLEELDVQKKSIEKDKENLDYQKVSYKSKKALLEKENVTLRNSLVVRNNYINKLSEEEIELQNKIDEYKKEIEKIEVEIVEATTKNIPIEYGGGELAWPVPGYYTITSPYGMRTHPITGVYKLHTGMDIRAPIGANFIAASDGVVTKAGYNTAYGKMVIIDHGGGICTLYAHGSEIMVEVRTDSFKR